MDKIDTSSMSANYWAKQFCDYKILKEWSLDDIDEALMVGWFANFWAAIHDPLKKKIDELYEIHQKKTDQLDNDGFEKDKQIENLEKRLAYFEKKYPHPYEHEL